MLVASNNFLVPNATFIVEVVAFLLVLGFLARYVLPPLNRAIEARQATVRQTLIDSETAKRRAEEAEADYKKTLDQARAEARAMVDEASRQGEQLRAELHQRGEQEYQRLMARAEADIQASARRAAEDLRGQVSGLVISVVERVVGEGFDTEAHRTLIDRTISEVESEAASAPELPV